MTQENLTDVFASVSFKGARHGQVRTLSGFKKGIHTVPDIANETTNRFLAKICESELSQEGEALYQRLRTGLGYKRRDLTLTVEPPFALLHGKEFSLEIMYDLEREAPSIYQIFTTLSGLSCVDILTKDVFNEICAGLFDRFTFALTQTVKVEDVIDAIEAFPRPGIKVAYPSDCLECSVSLEGFLGHIQCTTHSLDIVLPSKSSPQAFLEGFEALRGEGLPFDDLISTLDLGKD
ncbi:MAG: hypothetical protein JKY51_04200 [Opitutaceae bacterium]|nr:hypothetical protein [Opitutaceae bacterium]